MNSTVGKIILGNVFRTVLTAVITFFVTKNVIQADVASHLMRGDTVQLWNGTVGVNMPMVINVLVGLSLPILLPLALGIWTRVVERYKLIVARAQHFAATKQEIDAAADAAPISQIIKTVAAESQTS